MNSEYTTVLPTIKSALNKLLYCYIPIFIILSLIGFSWNIFFLLILSLETLDKVFMYFLKVNFTAYYYWVLDLMGLFVFENAKFISFVGLLSLTIAFFYFPPKISSSQKEFLLFFLPTYLALFSLSVTLFFTVLHRAIDKYSLNPSRVILSATNLKITTVTVLSTSFYFSFLLLFREPDSSQTEGLSHWILFQAEILTWIFILLILRFYKLSFYGFIDSFAKDISKSFFRNKSKGGYETAQKIVDAEGKNKKIYVLKYKLFLWFKSFWHLTILGSSQSFLGNYLSDKELEVIHEDVISIFRIAQKSVKNSDIKNFRACCHAIDEIFKAYIKSGNFYSSNNFTLNLRADIETLYKFCLEQKYEEEYLAIIVQMVTNMIHSASKLEIKNMHGTSETSTFEDLLVDFCLGGWNKKNSNATSLSINGLRDIGRNYVAQKKFRAAHSQVEKLYKIGRVISLIDSFWGRQMSKYVINGIIQIYGDKIIALKYGSETIMDYQRGEYRKWLVEIFTNLYKQDGFGSDSGNRPANSIFERHYFYDKNRITPLWIFIINIFDNKKSLKLRNNFYRVWEEIEEILPTITSLAYNAKIHESDRREFNSFLYAFLELIEKQYNDESESTHDLIYRIIERSVPLWFNKRYLLLLNEEGRDTESNLYISIIFMIILSKKSPRYEKVLLTCLEGIVETFKGYNEENDPYKHKRSRLYKNILLIGAWMYKFFSDEAIYKKIEKILLANIDLKQEKVYMMGKQQIKSFVLENYPEEEDLIFNKKKIWKSEKYCFSHPEFKLAKEDYSKFCENLNISYVLEKIKTKISQIIVIR